MAEIVSGVPPDLDRLAQLAMDALQRTITLRGDGVGVRITPSESKRLADGVLDLVARVRVLEAVAEAARLLRKRINTSAYSYIAEGEGVIRDFDAALAVLGGDRPEGGQKGSD